jgi:hypothetical protein
VFQNISNSTFIFFGWLALGTLTFVFYRRYRHEPVWEPLEVPPPPDREIDRLPPELRPTAARYRIGRRERVSAHAAPAPRPHEHRQHRLLGVELFFARHGRVRGVLIVLVFAAISGLAVGVDFSNYDPFGPGMNWSPGIVLVALMAAYLLNRSQGEV